MKKLIMVLLIVTLLCCTGCSKEEKDIMSLFPAALTQAGYTYTQDEPYYQMIGAIGGMKYDLGNGVAEVYVYDTKSDAYKQAKNTGMTMMNMPVVFNENVALYMADGELKEQIVDLFKGL